MRPNPNRRACSAPATIRFADRSTAEPKSRCVDEAEAGGWQCTAVAQLECREEWVDANGSALRLGFAGNDDMEGGGCCSGDTSATGQARTHKCAAGDRCTCGDDCKCAPGQPGCDACATFQAEMKAAKVAKEAAESTTA